jgi:hypothetical protein
MQGEFVHGVDLHIFDNSFALEQYLLASSIDVCSCCILRECGFAPRTQPVNTNARDNSRSSFADILKRVRGA